MVGLLGRVTGTVGPGLVGEVIVRIRGGAEHFLAYPSSPTDRMEPGTVVTVIDHLPRARCMWRARTTVEVHAQIS